jgi:hypothetical protein
VLLDPPTNKDKVAANSATPACPVFARSAWKGKEDTRGHKRTQEDTRGHTKTHEDTRGHHNKGKEVNQFHMYRE